MSEDKKFKLMFIAYIALFVAPAAIYFMVSIYGWLFLGNNINDDKSAVAFMIAAVATIIALPWQLGL